jgi:hypothetical protein
MADAPDLGIDVTGGCLCGAVRYRARTDNREGYYCHCRMCQLAFGNTRVPFFNLPQAAVTWEAEPRWYMSSKFAKRGFCSTCGTPLSFQYLDSERMDLAVGSLDDPSVLTPTSHFAVESRVENWHADDGLPGTRLDASEKLSARWKANYGSDVVPGASATRAA